MGWIPASYLKINLIEQDSTNFYVWQVALLLNKFFIFFMFYISYNKLLIIVSPFIFRENISRIWPIILDLDHDNFCRS